MESYDKIRLRAMYYSLDRIMCIEVRCSMESYDKVRQRAMYYSLDRIMYRSTLLYGILRQSTAEGDVLFARQDHV